MGEATAFDGVSASDLARLLDVPRVSLHDVTSSTLDVAHALAEQGAPAGTLVLADQQTAGRGRGSRRWTSPPGAGIWLTLVERPDDPTALEVLSLRLGLRAAAALDRFAAASVSLKWPNDLYLGAEKLAGTLVEARWRGGRAEWAAVGVGVNVVRPADVAHAAGLAPGVGRVEVLAELVPALRGAAAARGPLTPHELVAYGARDMARGRVCRAPAFGRVAGVTERGELLVATVRGAEAHRGGSLVFDREGA